MSEQINKVLYNIDQRSAVTTAEQKQARDNIGAQASITFTYSSSTITGIDGSAVGNPASLTGIDHDYNLSGSGTTASPLGLAPTITFSGQSAGHDLSSLKINSASLAFEIASANTATVDYKQVKVGYEWPSSLDVENHEGFLSHGLLEAGSLSLSAHNASYITHRVIGASVSGNPYLSLYDGYGSGTYQTAIHLMTHDNYRADPYIALSYSGNTEYVDQSSIQRWNSALPASASSNFMASVSANNNISGDGTSASPLGLNNKVILLSSDGSKSGTGVLNGLGLDFTGDPYTSTRYRVDGWSFLSTGDSTHSHSVGADVSGINLSWNNDFYTSNIHASGITQRDAWSNPIHTAEWSLSGAKLIDRYGRTALLETTGLSLKDSASGGWRSVDISAIDLWNSYSANHPGYSAIYLSGAETSYDTSYLPTGVTWPMRVDVWNLSNHSVNIKTDTFNGSTAAIAHGDSATIWYVPELGDWRDMHGI